MTPTLARGHFVSSGSLNILVIIWVVVSLDVSIDVGSEVLLLITLNLEEDRCLIFVEHLGRQVGDLGRWRYFINLCRYKNIGLKIAQCENYYTRQVGKKHAGIAFGWTSAVERNKTYELSFKYVLAHCCYSI